MKNPSATQILLGRPEFTPKIVVVGSINCDLTTYVTKFPVPHETVIGKRSALTLGGKGLNQAVAAARAGGSVEMIACIGNDSFGVLAKSYLINNGVGVQHVHTIDQCSTGTANILVDDNAQNMIAVALGANSRLSVDHVNAAELTIAAADIIVVQMEIPTESVIAALKLAKKYQVTTILNPAPASIDVLELLPLVDILTPNETEMEFLSGIYPHTFSNIVSGAKILQGMGARTVIVTRGADGCSIIHEDDAVHLDAYKVKAIDPTGAGDVFNGVLAVALVSAKDFYKDADVSVHSVKRASAAAALSVTKPLAEGAAPFAVDIEHFINREQITHVDVAI